MIKRIIGFAVMAATVLSLAACGGSGSGSSGSSKVSKPSGGGSVTVSGQLDQKILFDTDVWQAVPMVSQEILDNGYKGGEGCQWCTWITYDAVDGSYAYLGTDVGGVWRSVDGGVNWEPATIGLNTKGAVCIAGDPNNKERVALIGSDGTASGVFMSDDAGQTWSCKFKATCIISHDFRSQIVFDPTSYSEAAGGSAVMYWLRYSTTLDVGLYRSDDAGKTWKGIPNTTQYNEGWLNVDQKGNVFIANEKGLFRSTDKGENWQLVLNTQVNSVTSIPTKGYEKYVYAMTNDGLYVSTDNGVNFTNVTDAYPGTYARKLTNLAVSPVDPNLMVMQNDTLTDWGQYSVPCYYSTDGGKTWTNSEFDVQTNSWAPMSGRQRIFSFHPKQKNTILSLGGDCATRSTDGGKHFSISAQGYNSIYNPTTSFFNVNNPNLIAVSAQDYNGGYSTDGGKTWKYVNWSGKGWGGHVYGSYAMTEKTVIACWSTEWQAKEEAKRSIAVTYDGGNTVMRTDYPINGSSIAIGAKGNNDIAFIGEWRTTDGALSFEKMNGCTGVYAVDYKSGRLFGVNNMDIVTSADNGATWTTVLAGAVSDRHGFKAMSYDYKNNKLYATGWVGSLYCISLDKDYKSTSSYLPAILNGVRACGVAVDPRNPEIVYYTAYHLDYTLQNVWRSLDGGKTWSGLCREPGDGRKGPDGGNCAITCMVHPVTGELFTTSHCNGMWKISAPPAKYYK